MHSIELFDLPGMPRDLLVSLADTHTLQAWQRASNLAEASSLCRAYIILRGLQPADWKGGEVRDSGDAIARIAYNGRVWATIPSMVRRVADMFSRLLVEHVGEDNMREIARLNSIETAACVCHSHDFVDANMVMLDAITRAIGPHPIPDSPALMWLFDVAWQVARTSWSVPQWHISPDHDPAVVPISAALEKAPSDVPALTVRRTPRLTVSMPAQE